MIEAPGAAPRERVKALSCPWLDYLRGPNGENHSQCRLTGAAFGPGPREYAPCLTQCGYPREHARGRCRHLDPSIVIPVEGTPTLPKIACRAHRNFDAPGRCATCRDYAPVE